VPRLMVDILLDRPMEKAPSRTPGWGLFYRSS
jgi:hypothetical protein